MIGILLYSHHLPSRYCIDIVRRNYALVTCGSERVKSLSCLEVDKVHMSNPCTA